MPGNVVWTDDEGVTHEVSTAFTEYTLCGQLFVSEHLRKRVKLFVTCLWCVTDQDFASGVERVLAQIKRNGVLVDPRFFGGRILDGV